MYELLNVSFEGVKRLFVLAYDATNNDEAGIKAIKSIFFPEQRLKIITYWLMEEIYVASQLMI